MKQKIAQNFWMYFQPKTIALNLAVFFLYVFFGKLGLQLAYVNPSVTALWAPSGIAVAALLIVGYRVIPAVFLGAFVVNVLTAGGAFASLFISLGNTLEGVSAAYLVGRFTKAIDIFASVRNIFSYAFLAAGLSTMISATVGVATLLLSHLVSFENLGPVWLTWWLGDVGGVLIVAPVFLVWFAHPRVRFSYQGILHAFVAFSAFILLSQIIFLGYVPYEYLLIPLAVWIAFWFGRRGATITTLIVAVFAIYDTIHGSGPFVAHSSIDRSLLFLDLFLSTFSLTGLIFATVVLELRKGQKILSTQEKRFQAMIEKSIDAVVLIDATSLISYASPVVKRLLGYNPDELIGKIGFDLVYPEDRSYVIKQLAQLVLKPGGFLTVEYRSLKKDGKMIWIEATGTNLLLDPVVHAVVVNFHDISDRKTAEETLLEEKQEDEAMLGSIGDGIFASDENGKITMVNKRACEILQYTEKQLLHEYVTHVILMKDEIGNFIDDKDRPITKVLSLGKQIITSSSVFYLRKDKSVFPVHFTVTPIILNKKVVGSIEVFRDITREKEVDKAKTEFVSLASHQLRTPLATINWYLEELMKTTTGLTPKQVSYLKETYTASRRMVNLINSLLNTSRLELGTFVVEPEQVDLVRLSKDALKELQPKIEEKQIHVKESYQEKLPVLLADPKLLAIILQNLLANAVKYTREKDTIILDLRQKEKEFIISVTDHGYGIPKGQQDKVFTKLFRADNARSAVPEGTGLGLYIVKSILDATGGKISFVSEENKGTTFTVSFPVSGMKQKKGERQLM